MNEEIKQLNESIKKSNDIANHHIELLGGYNNKLYNALVSIENCFNLIKGVPPKEKGIFESASKTRLNWEESVKRIEHSLNVNSAKAVGSGLSGVTLGITVASLGPTAAMGIATTFGVASTGTAISSLSGVAATNAALAWLGGGALAAGGAGMAGGKLLLAFAGPIGWAIAGISLIASGIMFAIALKKKKRIEELIILMGEDQLKRLDLATIELRERMEVIDCEIKSINQAIVDIKSFGLDYDSMNEQQKYKLGAYVNLMYASSQLLIKPIDSLKQRYTENDFSAFLKSRRNHYNYQLYKNNKDIIIYFANQFYGIQMENNDYELMWKMNRKNKELLQTFEISKEDFVESIFWGARDALYYFRGY